MQLSSQHIDPLNSIYSGKAQRATFTFSLGPDQLDFANNFFANQYINECVNAVKSQSPTDDVLRIDVYRDTAPTFRTDYQLVITATDRTAGVLPWLAIIGLALIAIAIVYFVIRPVLKAVEDLVYTLGEVIKKATPIVPWIVGGIIAIIVLPRLLDAWTKKSEPVIVERVKS